MTIFVVRVAFDWFYKHSVFKKIVRKRYAKYRNLYACVCFDFSVGYGRSCCKRSEGVFMKWVTRELYRGKWHSRHFDDVKPAKVLCKKILKAGGVAICLRSAI